jgi:hypothetical protein
LRVELRGTRAFLVLDGPEGQLLKGSVDREFAGAFGVAVLLAGAGVPRDRWRGAVEAGIRMWGLSYLEPPSFQ